MGKVLALLGQGIVGLNYLLTCYLVAVNFGMGWAVIAFFAAPVGALAAPFFVNTWGFLLIGGALFLLGVALDEKQERKFRMKLASAQDVRNKELANQLMSAQVVSSARSMGFLERDPIRGPGKMLGDNLGQLIWHGESGVTFKIGDSIQSWGKSRYSTSSADFFVLTTTFKEFCIAEQDAGPWREWFMKHYPDKENVGG